MKKQVSLFLEKELTISSTQNIKVSGDIAPPLVGKPFSKRVVNY